MLEITILEGARGTGKSSVAFKLRQAMDDTTLINFTGFKEDGKHGFVKVSDYYYDWMNFLSAMANHKSKIVCDRFFFSEIVYSYLYKEYDFSEEYMDLCDDLDKLAQRGVKINIFFLTINNEEELKHRLIRDKVPFGKARESVKETMRQQEIYRQTFEAFGTSENLKIHTIDTSEKTSDEVYEEILKIKTVDEITEKLKTTE